MRVGAKRSSRSLGSWSEKRTGHLRDGWTGVTGGSPAGGTGAGEQDAGGGDEVGGHEETLAGCRGRRQACPTTIVRDCEGFWATRSGEDRERKPASGDFGDVSFCRCVPY